MSETDLSTASSRRLRSGARPSINITLTCPRPDITVCTVTGDVDKASEVALSDRVTEALHAGRPHVVIDLTRVGFFGSCGLRVLAEAQDNHDGDGTLAVVVGTNCHVRLPLQITALDQVLDLYHDQTEALQAARTHRSSATGHSATHVPDNRLDPCNVPKSGLLHLWRTRSGSLR